MGILYQTESFLSACISLVYEPDKPCSRQQPSCTNTRKELRRCVYRLGTIIQCIFCAQSGASIRLNFWKWSGESRYPGALSPVLENFRLAFSPDPTDCPWVSEDGRLPGKEIFASKQALAAPSCGTLNKNNIPLFWGYSMSVAYYECART